MSITIFRRKFKPSLVSTLLFILGFSIFLALSLWQLQRAEYKRQVQHTIDELATQTPLELQNITVTSKYEHHPARATGYYIPEHEIFIDNIMQNGKAGLYVMTPFKYSDNEVIYVNRGWIARHKTRDSLPITTIPSGEVTIYGTFNFPRSKPVMPDSMQNNLAGNKVWLYTDIKALAEKLKRPIAPLILRLSPQADGEYSRKWAKFDAKVAMHIGYFIHWLIFAIFVTVIYIYFGFKEPDDNN